MEKIMLKFGLGQQIRCKMYDGKWSELLYCGRIPPIDGLHAIIATNGEGCFALVKKPSGFEIVTGPVHLYPSLGSPETK